MFPADLQFCGNPHYANALRIRISFGNCSLEPLRNGLLYEFGQTIASTAELIIICDEAVDSFHAMDTPLPLPTI